MRILCTLSLAALACCGDAPDDPVSDGPTAIDAGPDGPATDAAPDAPVDAPLDAPTDAALPLDPTLSGVVRNLDDTTLANARVSFLERPDLVAMTAINGRFTIAVPAETPLTMRITHAAMVPTVVQPVIVHASTADLFFRMARPAQYAFIGTFGPDAPPPRGHARIEVVGMPPCDFVGGHLATDPPTGRIAYAQSNQLPNGSYTELQPNAPGAYLIAARGTFTTVLTDIAPPCAPAAFPFDLGSLTVLGPITIEDGAYHEISVFIE
jgi:hypothetical protein